MVRSPAALIIARNSNPDHIAANCANICVFLTSINQMRPLHPLSREIVGTLRPQYIARHMNVLPNPFFLGFLSDYLKLEVRFSLLELYISHKSTKTLAGCVLCDLQEVSILDWTQLALCICRDRMLAAIADEIRGFGILGCAREACGVGVKIAVLYVYLDTAHLMTSFSLRKQKSQRGSFSLRAAFSIEALMTCISEGYFFFKVLVGEELRGVGLGNVEFLEFCADCLVIGDKHEFQLFELVGDVAFVDLEGDLEVFDDLIDGSVAYLFKIESIDIVGNNFADE